MPEDKLCVATLLTCTAPVNIAVIKYWGKRNEDLILPINSSLSVTLHQNQLKTTTTVASCKHFKEDRIWLNGKEVDINHPRLQSCLREIRRLARKRHSDEENKSEKLNLSQKVHICSVNNFPTAAGLASSAAGYACLVYALAKLYGVQGELSKVARQGSGSACRSMYGGFVQWIMGNRSDGKDSIAEEIHPETHWPQLRILILVVSSERKPVGSTTGMQTSVKTSPLLKAYGFVKSGAQHAFMLSNFEVSVKVSDIVVPNRKLENVFMITNSFQYRAESVVPQRMKEMVDAIGKRNFEKFAELTMKDSNQFHATCGDTYPPIFYLNDVSKRIMNMVHRYNSHYGHIKAAYTFDAGPNAVIFTLDEDVGEFVELVKEYFPPETNGELFLKGLTVSKVTLSEELKSAIGMEPCSNGIDYIISTKVGPGPQMVEDTSCHLLGLDGLPKQNI